MSLDVSQVQDMSSWHLSFGLSSNASRLRELIQKSATKDLMYIHINPVEPKSLEIALKELQKFVGREVVVVNRL